MWVLDKERKSCSEEDKAREWMKVKSKKGCPPRAREHPFKFFVVGGNAPEINHVFPGGQWVTCDFVTCQSPLTSWAVSLLFISQAIISAHNSHERLVIARLYQLIIVEVTTRTQTGLVTVKPLMDQCPMFATSFRIDISACPKSLPTRSKTGLVF